MSTTSQTSLSSQKPAVRSWAAPVALGVWSLFVWGGRLRNLAIDDGGLASANRWSLAGSVIFVSLAILVFLAVSLRWSTRVTEGTVAALGLFTIVVWVVRGSGIASADHPAAFIAVHTILAVVSIGLAAVALKATGLQRRLGRRPAAG